MLKILIIFLLNFYLIINAFSLTCNSNFGTKVKQVHFQINNPLFKTQASRIFLDSLEDEKLTLMKLYKIDNDLYNKLSCFAFGLMGNESSFAKSISEEQLLKIFSKKNILSFHYLKLKYENSSRILKYEMKEKLPTGVAYIKSWKRGVIDKSLKVFSSLKEAEGRKKAFALATLIYFIKKIKLDLLLVQGKLKTSNNSRGPTQIKRVPKKIAQYYSITKEDLHNPKFSAIATLGFLAQSLKQLSNYGIEKKDYFNYLHYLYMGSSSQIRNGTATPERNIYLRNLRIYMQGLRVKQTN